MQEILTKFLDTVEQTPALLQLDGALRYVFPLLALVILIRCCLLYTSDAADE